MFRATVDKVRQLLNVGAAIRGLADEITSLAVAVGRLEWQRFPVLVAIRGTNDDGKLMTMGAMAWLKAGEESTLILDPMIPAKELTVSVSGGFMYACRVGSVDYIVSSLWRDVATEVFIPDRVTPGQRIMIIVTLPKPVQ